MLQNLYSWIKQGLASIKGFNTDLHEFFVSEGITASDFNTELLDWINQELGTSYKFLADAQYAYAASLLAPSVSDVKGYYEGASLDLDFVRNAGWNGTDLSTAESLLSVTRASAGYAENIDGSWTSFASGEARITNKGLLVEEARTNSIRNNSMQGAVAGTPGTMPTNWSITNAATMTVSVVGTGIENGIDYLDYRVSGTSDGDGGLVTIFFETNTGAAALSGQTWTISSFLKLVSGSLAGLTAGPRFQAWETTSGGVFVTATTASADLTIDGTFSRFTHTTTLSGGGTVACIRPYLTMSLPASTAFDFTLRIGWPQAEEGAFVTSPIRTTTAAATRAADVITTTDVNWFNASEGTLYSEATNPEHNPICVTWLIWDGTTAERMHIGSSGTKAQGFIASSSTTQLNSQPGAAFVGGEDYKIALAYKLNDGQVAVDGTASAVDTALTVPTGISEARIGLISPSNSVADGYIKRVAYLPTRLTEAQLQAITA